jgi:hypothetical protein
VAQQRVAPCGLFEALELALRKAARVELRSTAAL